MHYALMDSPTLILSADKHPSDYISSRHHGTFYIRKDHSVTEFPEDFKNKIYLLKHFEHYIMDRLYGDYKYTHQGNEILLVMHVDKNYKIARFTLSEIMALSLQLPVADPEPAKFNQRLVDELKYYKEVLPSIHNMNANQAATVMTWGWAEG
ncbi:hypothetical protein EDB19DRAFT_1960524 [Suillus lakei]|nr:hypothetical protein EDB19DRAFT_1960524 [Suillus lakei]